MSVIGIRDKYLKAKYSIAAFTYHQKIYIVNNTQKPSIFITSDLYLRANKSIVRDLSEIGHLQSMGEMIKEIRKELNDDEIDLSKLYNFKNKSSRSLSLKFKKEDFILPTSFSWINQVLLKDMHTPNDLKTIFE